MCAEVDKCYTDGMPYDLIQGQDQGHVRSKLAEMADFKVCLLRQYALIEKTNGRWIMILQDSI